MLYKKNYDIIFIPSQILGIGVLNCGIIVQKTIVVCLIVVWWQFWWQTNPISPSKMIYLSICYKSFYLDLWGFRVFGCDLIISPKPFMWVQLLPPLPFENNTNFYYFVGGFAVNIKLDTSSRKD